MDFRIFSLFASLFCASFSFFPIGFPSFSFHEVFAELKKKLLKGFSSTFYIKAHWNHKIIINGTLPASHHQAALKKLLQSFPLQESTTRGKSLKLHVWIWIAIEIIFPPTWRKNFFFLFIFTEIISKLDLGENVDANLFSFRIKCSDNLVRVEK